MSKIFSLVELEANTGITYSGYMSGMSDREDVENSDLYQELLEDCGGTESIKVTVNSYTYGEGGASLQTMRTWNISARKKTSPTGMKLTGCKATASPFIPNRFRK